MPVAIKIEPRELPVVAGRERQRFPWNHLSVGDWFCVETYSAYKDAPPSKMLNVIAAQCRDQSAKGERRFMPMHHGSELRVYRIK